MRILFNNLVDNSTLSSLYGSLNYPPINLKNKILRTRYQSSINYDYITCDFENNSLINSFYYGYTNATFMEVKYYIGSDSLVYTLTINNPVSAIGAHHFNNIVADFMIIYIVGSSIGVYLGGIGTGTDILLPNPVNAWNEPIIDNSLITEGINNEIYRDYIRGLRSYSWTFRETTREMTNYYRDLYLGIGLGRQLWIDLFEMDHDFLKPIYAVMVSPFSAKKEGRMYSFNLDIEEAR